MVLRPSLRILVHDYSGHPFQVELSRELARRGNVVRHVFFSGFQTPKGNLASDPLDSSGFTVTPIVLPGEFRKDSFVRRRAQEVAVGQQVARAIAEFRPDVVLSANAPLDTQRLILKATREAGARFVFWLQDIYSEAIGRLLPRRLPGIGHVIAPIYRRLENRLLRQSDRVVAITDDFVPLLIERGVAGDRIDVIENWAPINEIVPTSRDNAWAVENMPTPGLRVVYSGTLGYKHNPDLLLEVARAIEGTVYVFSEGSAASKLKADAASRGITNLVVSGWVPFADLPKMLGGADVFLAMIEEDAGVFSVPSKVLSYLAAGRPMVGSIPDANLARKLILREEAGLVSRPGDVAGFVEAVRILARDPAYRERAGRNGRRYAERAFRVDAIADRFEPILGVPQRVPSEGNAS